MRAHDRIIEREVFMMHRRAERVRAQAAGETFNKFSTLATIDGFDVIDSATGHAVAHRDSLASANGAAYRLNKAAADGTLAFALGARN